MDTILITLQGAIQDIDSLHCLLAFGVSASAKLCMLTRIKANRQMEFI